MSDSEQALKVALEAGGNAVPDPYNLSVSQDEACWVFVFTPRGAVLGGDVTVRIGRAQFDVVSVVRGQ